jgi:ATP-dependent helicase/DNAse subunit B
MRYCLQFNHIYDESMGVANEIRGLVNAGARYFDIVLALADYENTAAVFCEALSRCGVPYNVDIGGKLMDNAITKRLRDIMLGAEWAERIPIKGKTAKQFATQIGNIVADEKFINQFEQDIETNKLCTDEILKILGQITTILGDKEIPLREFTGMFCAISSGCKVSNVPTYLDRVLVVDVNEYEVAAVPYLFVASAADGVFPTPAADTGIITEQDIKNLKIKIEPSATLQTKRAFLHAEQVLQSAKAVYASYSVVDTSGERIGVSPIVGDFARYSVGVPHCAAFAESLIVRGISDGTAAGDAAYFESLKRAAGMGAFKIPNLNAQPENITRPEIGGGKRLRVTAIESYVKCPHYHFLTNTLGLEKFEPADKISPRIVGQILHKFAEICVKNPEKPPENVIKDLLLPHKFPTFIVRRIRRQAGLIAKTLAAEIEKCEFKPTFFEYDLDGEIDGTPVTGRADRIDTKPNGEFVVVDYKSGGAGVVRLQLPLYMKFFPNKHKGKVYTPAGAYYLNLRDFTRREIKADKCAAEVDTAVKTATDAVRGIRRGVITKCAVYPSICDYCPAGASCMERKI